MGVSVENDAVTWRIDHLRKVPAEVRFLSCPLLIRFSTGRIAYTATIALNVLSTLGSTGGVLYRVPSAISYFSALNVG
jgi:protein gp37